MTSDEALKDINIILNQIEKAQYDDLFWMVANLANIIKVQDSQIKALKIRINRLTIK